MIILPVNAILQGQQKPITTDSATNLTGVLAGDGQNIGVKPVDAAPTASSSNLVSSGGVKSALNDIESGITPVALAENLTSDSAQSSAETFIERTTGGTASLSDGDGWIQIIRGTHAHTGYTARDITMSVVPATHTLTASINKTTFLGQVGYTTGTKTFTYNGSSWSENLATYGITITSGTTPLSGDSITVEYSTTQTYNATLSQATREEGVDGISIEVNDENFWAAIINSGTLTGSLQFTYSSSWDINPSSYGITVTGTPISGDSITITYSTSQSAGDPLVVPIVHSISATIDELAFEAQMEVEEKTQGTETFTYNSGAWNKTLATYGITVTGSPLNGDVITVNYQVEIRGTITHSNPQTFVSSGWNLYDHTNGYARVLKYSEDYGFGIAGTYTSIGFSTTPMGTPTPITPNNGRFNINEDGYIIVEGGNNTDTQIWMTWSDWTTQANGGTWEAYTESVVDFSSVMSAYFPYGLMEVGNYRDEINFSSGTATQNIARDSYANLATIQALGVDYEYDENYVYYALPTPIVNSITVNNQVAAYDHGMEWFTTITLPVHVQTTYGVNLKNKLERDVVTISQQDLSDSDAAQVQENLKISYRTNPNLLYNWYFGPGLFPINQRGSSSYAPGAGTVYSIDGWKVQADCSLAVYSNWIIYSTTGSGVTNFYQVLNNKIEGGKTYTVSMLCYSSAVGNILYSGKITSPTSTGNVSYSDPFTTPNGQTFYLAAIYTQTGDRTVSLRTENNAIALNIIAMKLEIGSMQTLAHQENGTWVLNEIPDYMEELVRCNTKYTDVNDPQANQKIMTNQTVSNPNLLYNWYFPNPVNQRSKTQYTDSAAYSIDRWIIENCKLYVTAGSYIQMQLNSGTYCSILQKIENFAALRGKKVTASILIGAGLITGTATIASSGGGYLSIVDDTASNIVIVVDLQNEFIYFRRTNSTSWTNIIAVKLELGDTQTLAHQENGAWVLNEIPNYEEELFKCQTSIASSADTYANQTNVADRCYSRPNLLDNWYFVGGGTEGAFPINQRGGGTSTAYSYTSTGYWGIDRWAFNDYIPSGGNYSSNPTLLIASNGITLGSTDGKLGRIIQRPQWGKSELMNKTVTLSVLITAVSGTPDANGSYGSIGMGKCSAKHVENGIANSQRSITGVGLYSTTFVLPTWSQSSSQYNGVAITAQGGCTITVAAMKLELGSTQTLAHQEAGVWVVNEIPDYGEQLARCQRYLYPFYGDGYRASVITANLMFCVVPTSLRNGATVTIAANNLSIKSLAGTEQTGFTFSMTGASRYGKIEVQASKTSHGLTDGSLYSGGTTLFLAETF